MKGGSAAPKNPESLVDYLLDCQRATEESSPLAAAGMVMGTVAPPLQGRVHISSGCGGPSRSALAAGAVGGQSLPQHWIWIPAF